MREPLIVESDRVEIFAKTDSAAIGSAVASLSDGGSVRLNLPVPDASVTAVAAALEGRPQITLGLDGRVWDRPGLSIEWLDQFPHLRSLRVGVYDALDLSPIGHLHNLRKLSVGETKRRSLSLAFLAETPLIERLWLDGQGGRDFDAVAGLDRLRIVYLRGLRSKTLEPLREHATLEGVDISLGGVRDLTPLATIPNMKALFLWGIRLLDTDDFAAIGDCTTLGGLSIGALRHVRNLAALARGPAKTLRFLMVDRMTGLETLSHLGQCQRVEEIALFDARPADRRLDLVAAAPSLIHLGTADAYTKAEVEAADSVFRGKTFVQYGNMMVRDDGTRQNTHWRMSVEEYLALL